MFPIYRVSFIAIFFDNCSVFRTAEAYLDSTLRENGISMTSQLHSQYVVIDKF